MIKKSRILLAVAVVALVQFSAVTFFYTNQVAYASTPVTPGASATPGTTVPSGCRTKSDGLLSVSNIGIPTYGCGNDRSIIQTILQLVFGAMAMFSLLFLVIGGLRYTLSGGDSNAIAQAKKTITYALLGLVLGISTFTIVGFIFGRLS